ncbi:MAG: thioredoxin family protein [Nanoarchaeota archaeon]|nr:thioredoxin family protein [Nanoarchaeota archaeon]MBU1005378.1 thioredoxin family protein [Nanoarchaeota archaeon]MBU1945954.1 thioredoxin family protein [Nanoarchaeota archaeon]
MKKSDKIKALISVIVILILAIIIINMNSLVPGTDQIGAGQLVTTQTIGVDNNAIVDSSTCIGKYGVPENAVVFVHSTSCPHCQTMMPIVRELEGEGYSFYWAEGSNNEARQLISDCLSGIVGGYVPQFICPKTGIEQTGAMSESQLRTFADECV